MFSIIHEYHEVLRKAGLKAASEKYLCFLKKVKFLGHVISTGGMQPFAKRVEDRKYLKSPYCKRDVTKVLGCLGFYSCYIKTLHVDSKPFYDIITDSTSFHWTNEHEKIFQMIKHRISEVAILTFPSTEYPFRTPVDSSKVGTACILIQQFSDGKRIICFIFWASDKAEQKNQHTTGNCREMFQQCRLINNTSLDLLFQFNCIVTIKQSSNCGVATDSCPTVCSDIKE